MCAKVCLCGGGGGWECGCVTVDVYLYIYSLKIYGPSNTMNYKISQVIAIIISVMIIRK